MRAMHHVMCDVQEFAEFHHVMYKNLWCCLGKQLKEQLALSCLLADDVSELGNGAKVGEGSGQSQQVVAV